MPGSQIHKKQGIGARTGRVLKNPAFCVE